jgi:glutamate 5-kinase
MRKFENVKRIVVKIGTSVLTRPDGTLNKNYMKQVAGQVSQLIKEGRTVIIVSSGAIVSGIKELGLDTMPRDIPSRQAAAAVGQSILMETWRRVFRKHGIQVAQILLTYEAFSTRRTYVNLRNSMIILTKHETVPVINENDPISVHEIEATFGDNDKLSAMVAANTDAQLLILLTDVNGLYTKNPKHKDAQLISEVTDTHAIEAISGEPGSWRSKGGMKTKIEAARISTMSNCTMVIANAREKDAITRIVEGDEIGTVFRPAPSWSSSKEKWIRHSISNGRIAVDQRAREALLRGSSLLPSGVVEVDGEFEVGSVVSIFSSGSEIAKGVVDYSSEELNKIKGKHTSQIEKILGYKNYNNVVRRENMTFTCYPSKQTGV